MLPASRSPVSGIFGGNETLPKGQERGPWAVFEGVSEVLGAWDLARVCRPLARSVSIGEAKQQKLFFSVCLLGNFTRNLVSSLFKKYPLDSFVFKDLQEILGTIFP